MQWLILLLLPVLANAQPAKHRDFPTTDSTGDRLERLENQLKNLPRDDYGQLEQRIQNIPRGNCCDTVKDLVAEVNAIGLEQATRSSRITRLERDTTELTIALKEVYRTALLTEARTLQNAADTASMETKWWLTISAILIQVVTTGPLAFRAVKHYRRKSSETGDGE